VSLERVVKNRVRGETVSITRQRANLITVMIVKDGDVKGKGILELTEIFLVAA